MHRSGERWRLKKYCLFAATKKRQVRAEEDKSKDYENWSKTGHRERGTELAMDERNEPHRRNQMREKQLFQETFPSSSPE